jgi:twinkle protein
MYETNYDKLSALGIDLKGKRTGQTKVVCPKCSTTRKHKRDPSLSVDIDTGAFNCHNSPCDFRGSVAVAKRPEKAYSKPVVWTNVTQLSDNLVNWFRQERGISQQTLIKMQIGEGLHWFFASKDRPAGEKNAIWFPYVRNGELINMKYRSSDKRFMLHKDAELIFYNLDSIKQSKTAYIVEGELDVLALVDIGIDPVISVPNGASMGKMDLRYVDNCIDDLEHLEKIVIATDDDLPGRALKDELIRRLGPERCWTVDFDAVNYEYNKALPPDKQKHLKDNNDVLLHAGRIALETLMLNAAPVPIKGIRDIKSLRNDVFDLFKKGMPPGAAINMRDEKGELLTFAPGQLTVGTGIPNHGKSEVVDQIICLLAVMYGWKFGIYSPENWPLVLHLSKLIEKLIGKQFSAAAGYTNRITPEEIEMALAFIEEHFFFIDPDEDDEEDMTLERILEYGKIMVKRFGINGFVIDPWNTIEHQVPPGMDGLSYISKALGKINKFDRKNGVHTFLIAHPTKLKKEKKRGSDKMDYPVPTLYDISGSANFRDKAFNGFSVYRDFEKGHTEIHFQKVKFKHQGHQGIWPCVYDVRNGRYRHVNDPPDMRNWITQGADPYIPPTITIDENSDIVIPTGDTDENPF